MGSVELGDWKSGSYDKRGSPANTVKILRVNILKTILAGTILGYQYRSKGYVIVKGDLVNQEDWFDHVKNFTYSEKHGVFQGENCMC